METAAIDGETNLKMKFPASVPKEEKENNNNSSKTSDNNSSNSGYKNQFEVDKVRSKVTGPLSSLR